MAKYLTHEEHLQLAPLVVALTRGLLIDRLDINRWPKNSPVVTRQRQVNNAVIRLKHQLDDLWFELPGFITDRPIIYCANPKYCPQLEIILGHDGR
jgi:hypothetical protein